MATFMSRDLFLPRLLSFMPTMSSFVSGGMKESSQRYQNICPRDPKQKLTSERELGNLDKKYRMTLYIFKFSLIYSFEKSCFKEDKSATVCKNDIHLLSEYVPMSQRI